MAGEAKDLPLALLLFWFHRCDKAPQELIEVSRLLPLAAFLLTSSCLWTLAGACASEAGLLLSFTEDCKVARSSSSQGSSQLPFTKASNSCDLRIPKLLPSPAQRSQGWNKAALQLLTLSHPTESWETCGSTLRRGAAGASASLLFTPGVCGTQKPPGNASVRRWDLAFSL